MPLVSFSPDGSVLYAPLLSVAPGGELETRIWACPTSTPGCTESVRKWTSVVKAEVQTWYRVGLDLVKPHPWLDQGGARRSWYRIAKGP